MHPLRSTLAFLLIAASTGCFYAHATVNVVDLESQGLVLEESRPPPIQARQLGKARANERAFLFSDCDALANQALEKLLQNVRRMGGTGVARVRFLGRWSWVAEPVCRRNYYYGFLLVPLFLPVPMSVTVSGIAVRDSSTPDP